jgi:hypothetical protein
MRFRLPPRYPFMLGLFLSALVVAACGSEKTGNLPGNVVITLRPRPVATVLPGCITGELSDWYEVAGTLIDTFKDESNAALDRTPDEMRPVLDRLIDLRDAIANQPVPECALDAHGEIVLATQEMLTAIQRYINGDLDADGLAERVTAGSTRIESDVTDLLGAVRGTLDEQNRRARQTPQPTAGSSPAAGN